MMEELWIVPWTTILSILVLFILSKIVGVRTFSNMSMYDYINSIAIGSIAAQLSTSTDEKIIHNLLAMILYGGITFACAIATDKSKKVRNLIEGHPMILMEKGKIYPKHFAKAHIDIEEFQAAIRELGYFDISKVDTAILETNGKFSVIPIASEKPVVAKDLSLHPEQEAIVSNIMMDGKILYDNLKRMGKDETWLQKQISTYKIKNVKDIFLATLDQSDTVNFYIKAMPPDKNIL